MNVSAFVADDEILYRAIIRIKPPRIKNGALQVSLFLEKRSNGRGQVCVDQSMGRSHMACYSFLKATFFGKFTCGSDPAPLFLGATTLAAKTVHDNGLVVVPEILTENPYHAYINMMGLSEEEELRAAHYLKDNCIGIFIDGEDNESVHVATSEIQIDNEVTN